jgi:hypothetical protein
LSGAVAADATDAATRGVGKPSLTLASIKLNPLRAHPRSVPGNVCFNSGKPARCHLQPAAWQTCRVAG